jgi:alpha-D-xyloside xylohydrolase
MPTYELPTFLGETVPVDLVAELRDWQLSESGILLRCATLHMQPQLHNYYGTTCETLLTPPTPGKPLALQIDLLTPQLLRLRMAPGDTVPEHTTPMVVGHFAAPVAFEISETSTTLTLTTAAVRLVIDREPFRLSLFDAAGTLIWRTRPVDIAGLRRPEFQWNPAEQRWLFLHRYAYPLGRTRAGQPRVFASFELGYDEHIYGFGESYGRLDRRETHQKLWIQEVFSNAVPAGYKRTPFYLSTAGYGCFVNTSNAINVRVGELEHTALSLTVDDTDLLDWYLFAGPTLADLLPQYTALTGQPGVPPKWSFGLWMARISYNRQVQVEQVAAELREHAIPCDVIHIDTDWFEHDWGCDLRFGPSKFPDPAGMCERLREQGFRVCLWQWPNMLIGTSMFEEGRAQGFLIKRTHDKVYTQPGFMEDAGAIDYSNPAAVAWVQQKFRDLFALGVAAIKADFGEGAPPDGVYHGAPGTAMHNLYPLLYNQAVFEVTEESTGEGIIWARSAWAGSQRYPLHWSGDGVARFEDLACVLRATLSFGMSGFPFYSHDIGGFSGLPNAELYVRWAQLGLFSSHARCHGTPPREPWAFGTQAETIFRQYCELRYRLMPYIYTEALNCGDSSLPLVRPLVLAYQNDPTTHTIDDQYLFGPNLLVAPILSERNQRQVYLPPGEWVDFHTHTRHRGGRWLLVDAPLAVLPLFVPAGAIIPTGPLMQHVDQVALDPLTVTIYAPGEQGSYTIRDHTQPPIQIEYQRVDGQVQVQVHGAPGHVEVVLVGE